ncbi:hypothetical protein N7539_003239 [Penicillium diatomitis]|uniref:Uncharacterized protein n=1 Tax=Penicillium diatomitis TaxID=2819901 RepID=A0A9W9XGD4_9EURO|nr:uncharacterized protein N7539_003239 [Penicillium diatomitis]KAJ5491672.1 hypothetical protein N7539_003239 [Penicillium diatomitis]
MRISSKILVILRNFLQTISTLPSITYNRNIYILPEIIFNLSLILSPYIFLLGLLFADRAFKRVKGEEVLISVE